MTLHSIKKQTNKKQEVCSPSIHSLLLKLRDTKRERAHEVIPAGQIPVPDLHRQPAVFVRLLQITVRQKQMREGDKDKASMLREFDSPFTRQTLPVTRRGWTKAQKQTENFLTM